jgi:hypothetical protein
MYRAPRWLLAVLIVLAIVGLLAFARGRPHHRGDEPGTNGLGGPVALITIAG